MKITGIPFDKINQLSKRDKDYQSNVPALRPFYKYQVEISAFKDVIEAKALHPINRVLLVDQLQSQYSTVDQTELVSNNIEALGAENTFTITTAHQPSLMTGPLYYIYKICSTINLTKQLNIKYPEYTFVPVFVSGGEDHDFEEVNHLHLYNKKIEWTANHNGEPVGRMPLDGIPEVLNTLKEILRENSTAQKLIQFIDNESTSIETYGSLMFSIVNKLFGQFGLVFLNMDNIAFKKAFAPTIKKEIFNQKSKSIVQKTQSVLEQSGYKSQAFVREINFFFITKHGQRKRIEEVDNLFKIVDTDIVFTKEEFLKKIEEEPGSFSPNVVMRPIYQESILPNLAYIGGGGELAYWLERMDQFNAFEVPFPMLIRRNSVMLMDQGTNKTLEKLGLSFEDILEDKHSVINQFLDKIGGDEFSLDSYKNDLEQVFTAITDKAILIDPTLKGKVEAEKTKSIKAIEQIESRLKKNIKQKSETEIKRIEKIYQTLFPNNGLQERKTNVLEFLDKYDLSIIEELITHLDPMNKNFILLHL